MNKNQVKGLLRTAAVIYVLSFILINWSEVSWIFNYKAVYGMVDDFFNPYPSTDADASLMESYFYPNHSEQKNNLIQNSTQIDQSEYVYTDKQNRLEVPKINLDVPIIFSTSSDPNVIDNDLDQGVVYYPGSVYPGQKGQIVILGHSAPSGWPMIKHDWVFSELNNMETGDIIMIHLNNRRYTYVVKDKKIIEKGGDVPNNSSAEDKSILHLISCWPPGKNRQRIVVSSELQNTP